MCTMNLVLRSILWAILCPGTVTVLVPWMVLDQRPEQWPMDWRGWIGMCFFIVGALVLIWCIFAFARFGKGTLSPADPTTHLVVKGLYRYVRNPMYVGVLCILIGELISFPNLTMLVYVFGVFIAFHTFIVFFEEPRLQRQFGAEYDRYRAHVHRWIPGKPYQH